MFFRPHDTYEYFGLCTDENKLKIKKPYMETCDKYREVELEYLKKVLLWKGWLHCLTCNKAIYSVEELFQHLDDELGPYVFSEIVASEEAPIAS